MLCLLLSESEFFNQLMKITIFLYNDTCVYFSKACFHSPSKWYGCEATFNKLNCIVF